MNKDFDVSVVHGLFVALMFTYLLITFEVPWTKTLMSLLYMVSSLY